MTEAPTPAAVSARPAAAWAGWAYAWLSTLGFSAVTPIGKAVIDEGMPASAVVVIRLTGAVALFGLTLALTGPARLRVSRRTLWTSALVGLTNGVGMLTYFGSLRYIDSSIAAMIFSVSPLITLLLLAARGEAFTRRHGLRLALGLAGVYLLIGPGGTVNVVGALLAAVSVFTVPVQLVVIQWFLPDGDAQAASFYMLAGMLLTALLGWAAQGAPWQTPTPGGWTAIALVTVIGTYFSRLWMFLSVQRLGSAQVGLLAPLETLLTVIWSVLFLQERLTPAQWLGGALILTSGLLAIQRLSQLRLRRRGR